MVIGGGALLLGCVHWRLLNYLTDWSNLGNAGMLWAAALLAVSLWIGSILFRVPGSVASRTASAAILFLASSYIDLGTPDTPALWWLVAGVSTLPVGLVTAYFLRGVRDQAAAAAVGYLLPALGVWWLVEYSMWFWVPFEVLFYFAVALLAAVAWRYKLSSMAWLSLTSVALIAGFSYPNYLEMRNETAQRTSDSEMVLPTIDGGRRLQPTSERSGSVFRLGGQWVGTYPVDFASRPAALIALLQFQNHNLLVLAVVPPFSPLPLEMARFSWVARIDWVSSDPALARFLTNATPGYYDAVISYMATPFQLGGPYDLLFVTDGNPDEWVKFLTPGGVLAVTPNTDRPELARQFAHRMPVPGPGRVVFYSHRPLETDLEAMDRQMALAAMGEAPLQAGALGVLYSLPADYADDPIPVPAEYLSRWPEGSWIRPPWHAGGMAEQWWLGIALVGLLAARCGRFWLERWAQWQRIGSDVDAGISLGIGLVLVWSGLARQGEPLFYQAAGMAAAALAAGTLPSGIRKAMGILIWIAPLAGVALLGFAPWGAVLAGVIAVLGIGYWRGGHSSHAPWASSRVLWSLALVLVLAALSLPLAGGLWVLTLAAFIWRRMPF